MACTARVLAADAMFPFIVSYDSPANVTNLSTWLATPAGKHGHIRVKDGHFIHDEGTIRFWGTNLCFDACFPSKADAEKLARRLARFGINVVRMHHMDSHSIWGTSPNKTTIDPEQLDRLDYFVWQLKRNGIYTNLNLHVSRSLGATEGFPAPNQRPTYDKGLDNFEPRMIELQKKYARDLLTHVNPYTHTAYRDEPAVAFVEINNENALFDQWSHGNLDKLPEPYTSTFRGLWHEWLVAKYATTPRLREAWNREQQPLGDELLRNGDFARPLGPEWHFERDGQTEADWLIKPRGRGDASCLRVNVIRNGDVAWHPQFSQAGFAVKRGQSYTLSFWVRSEQRSQLNVNCMMAHAPWQRLGGSFDVTADLMWSEQRLTFVADQDDSNARITGRSRSSGVYEVSQFSLRQGGTRGLQPDEGLETQNIPVLGHADSTRTPTARRDFIDFLWDTEQSYWTEMDRFLKQELGVHALVSGTQLSYSPVHIQSQLDYLDAHAYWQHPRFPNRPWDRRDWYVEDLAMVNQRGGTLTDLAGRRVAGMPYTISEYNHPNPNSYTAEGLPMLAAMAAWQAWDGVYHFTYSHDTDFEPTRLSNFFDVKGDPAKLVHMPAAVAMFVRGDLEPAATMTLVPLSREAERKKLYEGNGDPWRLRMSAFGMASALPLSQRVAFDLHPSSPYTPSGTGESPRVRWGVDGGRGAFIASTNRSKFFTGFVDSTSDRPIDLDNVQLRVGRTQLGWATISLTCIDGGGFNHPGRILVAASGLQQNSHAKLERLGSDRVTLRDQWGDSPLLCEGINAEITLPLPAERVEYFSLDAAGNRQQALKVAGDEHASRLMLDAKYQTLWYEVVVR
ncbi:MAG: carbohydrate binding domain-containing protein [Planctomycetales bacterium]|nr:carbohydrate binding domain-containing protein [Planctomycetales bacterium]